MGIPALFRWLSDKYPKIMTNVIEELPKEVDDKTVPVDSSMPNPNGVEIDNLYLDMNGIIHPCCHPEDKPAPATEEEMYIEIFKYIDRIFAMIRPRKVLYMAIDGVAPRAKMNQQRSRRFRAAQEEEIKRKDEERIRLETGQALNTDLPKKEHFDSNCITPGTPFMEQLAICLRYYIIDRLNNDPGWKNIQVFLSDASVPGEGEHKIMDYIRRQKIVSTYDPNTKHVIYGLDADLIMLALATHEPHFYILREDVSVKRNRERACQICGQSGHDAFNCRGKKKEIVGTWDDQTKYLEQKPFLFVHISVLREYLDVEMKLLDAPFEWDLERAVDDWVFMCFFVGNDFLPHLPSLEIKEGAVELLIGIWKNQAKTWDDYLTNSGDINLSRVQSIMEELGKVEDVIFKERREGEERRRLSRLERKRQNRMDQTKDEYGRLPNALRKSEAYIQEQMSGVEAFTVQSRAAVDLKNTRKRPLESSPSDQASKKPFSFQNPSITASANKDAALKLKMQLLGKLKKTADSNPQGGFSIADFQATEAEPEVEEHTIEVSKNVVVETVVSTVDGIAADTKEEEINGEDEEAEEEEEELEAGDAPHIKPEPIDSDEESPEDDVRLWEDGWKARYYEKKFDVDVGDEKFRQSVVKAYVEGLCWVLKYYYQGVQSWKWFYPFHYSPFASDFKNVSDIQVSFEKSQPFKPVEQLMGVFPAASKKHIPKIFHSLMTDPDSPIVDFYPVEFPIDLNGKKYAWQGVALLPFIDAERLLKAMEPLYPKLTQEEIERNTMGSDVLFTSSIHSNFEYMCSIYRTPPIKKPILLDSQKSGGVCGSVFRDPKVTFPGSTHPSPLAEFNMQDIVNDGSISAVYYLPSIPSNYKFKATLLSETKLPTFILDENDKYVVRNGLNVRGRGGGRGGRGGNRAAFRMIRHGLSLSKSESNSSTNGHGGSSRSVRDDRGEYGRRSDERGDYGRRYNDRGDYGRRSDDRSPRGREGGSSRDSHSYREEYSRRSYEDDRRGRSYGDRPPPRERYSHHYDNRSGRGGHSGYSYGSLPGNQGDSPYMGGGGYANYNRDGKYLGSGYVPTVSSADLNSSFYSSRSSGYSNRNGSQYQQTSYSSFREQNPYQNYQQSQYSQQSYNGGQAGQPSQQYQSYGFPQAAVPPNSDASSIVANLLNLLPGGSQVNQNQNHNSFGNNRNGGRSG